MEGREERPWPSPAHQLPPTIFSDISNFRTPQKPSESLPFQSPRTEFFTASKQTPTSSFRRRSSVAPSTVKARAARRLKEFELEQSQSSRKAQVKKERSLRCLSKSLTAWLNFLFENPKLCGCDNLPHGDGKSAKEILSYRKRESHPGSGVGVGREWQSTKRQKDCWWHAGESASPDFSNSMFSSLENSLQGVCSFEDLKQRMNMYLSLSNCKSIFKVMTPIAKSIDEGRVKMKAHCPIVTDVGMKEKAFRTLMCYNPIWLRIGLYIILGGDSLQPDGDSDSVQETAFLKMVVEKQFFSHAGLAKAYAYNKLVDGLYRPGYFEALGNVVLKRFLLLALVLDHTKSLCSLSMNNGIDGVDGGSPLLFTPQSYIKSSSQMINDFLSTDVMHGQGNLLAHLVILGYRVSYKQCSLIEYDFRVNNLFDDMRDGVRLARAFQLLKHDNSIMTKIVVPSDTRKKCIKNCSTALQYLKEAGGPLHDEDGTVIGGDDVVAGDRELIISLLWNIFVHLQLPLLINKQLLLEEINKIHGVEVNLSRSSTYLEMILSWIQGICENYCIQVQNFTSLVDGKAMWCLLDYYFQKELPCFQKDPNNVKSKVSLVSDSGNTDAFHSFMLSQKLLTILGSFPEVLQIGDVLEHNGACNDRSVIILLVFLLSQLVFKQNKDQLNFHKFLDCNCSSSRRRYLSMSSWPLRIKEDDQENENEQDAEKKFKMIQTWWHDMSKRNDTLGKEMEIPATYPKSQNLWAYTGVTATNAAVVVQTNYRCWIVRRNYVKLRNAASILKTAMYAWIRVKETRSIQELHLAKNVYLSSERWKKSEISRRYILFMFDRHSFVKSKKLIMIIQTTTRSWLRRKRFYHGSTARYHDISSVHQVYSIISEVKIASDLRERSAVLIQYGWRNYAARKHDDLRILAATNIQKHFWGWHCRRSLHNQKLAVIKIQSKFRCFLNLMEFRRTRRSVIIIQAYVRGYVARRQNFLLQNSAAVIQSHWRGFWARRNYIFCRSAIIIQSAIRRQKCSKKFYLWRLAAIDIQCSIRSSLARNVLSVTLTSKTLKEKMILYSVLKLQKWWKGVLFARLESKSATVIQSYTRRWLAIHEISRWRRHIFVIQSCWRGYLTRKKSRIQFADLRLRMQKSAMNVDDGKRLINRLLSALQELLNMKSVSSILHTCATLDMATQYSEKCCEELLAAGAVEILVKEIGSVSRSMPDQEVVKHALSALRNLSHYAHFVDVLIDTPQCVETTFCQMLRNKSEIYFIASEILKKMCSRQKGVEALKSSNAFLKRLQHLTTELSQKTFKEKRSARRRFGKTSTERRLREAQELLKLIRNG